MNPFEQELARRTAAREEEGLNPFEAELKKRRDQQTAEGANQIAPDVPMGTIVADAANQFIRGFNKGLVGLATMPYRGIDWLGEKATGGDFLPNVEEMSLYKPFLQQPEAKTTTGRYAGSVGEVVGSSALPSGAILSQAPRMAALAPATLPRAVAQTVGSQVAARPGAAVAADLVASTGAGLAQQGAEDAGFGPVGQTIAGIAGGVAPFAVAAPFSTARHYVGHARANSDPHARIAAALPENLPVDELAESIATGTTGQVGDLAARIFNTIGEEMVRAGGNRQAALPNILRRLEIEGGVSPATARDQLRRVVNAQADNELMLGEYPAVARSNENTRGRQAPVIMRELDTADNMPNRQVGNAHRVANDPGRVEDSGTHWMLDTVANAGTGASSKTVRNAIDDRLVALANQAMARIRSWAEPARTNVRNQAGVQGALSDDMLEDADLAIRNITDAGRRAYRDVYDAPGGTAVNYGLLHPLLARVVNRHLNRLAGFGGDQAEELRKAINGLYLERPSGIFARGELPELEDQFARARWLVREGRRQGEPREVIDALTRDAERIGEELRLARRDATPGTQSYLLPTLEQLQNMRSALFNRINNELAGRPDMQVVLGPLYRDLTRIMERASPQWRIANRQWADLRLDRLARELGENLADRAGPNYRQQMRQFRQLAPEAQDFVRIEFAQQLIDKIRNIGVGENLAKLFKTPHIRDMVRTIMGDAVAVDMARLVRDNVVAGRSKQMMHGSPTQPRQARQAEMDADLNLLAARDLPTTPGQFLGRLQQYVVNIMRERRNRDIANVLTTPMRDTLSTAQHVEHMRRARAVANQYANQPVRQSGRAGLIGSILNELDELD